MYVSKYKYIYIYIHLLNCSSATIFTLRLRLQLGGSKTKWPSAAVAWYDHPGEDHHDPSARNCASSHLELPQVRNDKGSGFPAQVILKWWKITSSFQGIYIYIYIFFALFFPVTAWSTKNQPHQQVGTSLFRIPKNIPSDPDPIHPSKAAKSNFLGFVLVDRSCTWKIQWLNVNVSPN